MMKKYLMISLGIILHGVSSAEGFQDWGAVGPIPFPFTSQTTLSNPTLRMTPQQKRSVYDAFVWAQSAFQKNHYACRGRTQCLNLDLTSLANYVSMYPTAPVEPLFRDIYNIIRYDSQHQKFVTQWVIFSNLSASRQTEYRRGVRVTPVQGQYVRTPYGTTAPAYFNQDDVLTDLLQAVDHYHRNCNQYITCLSGDLKLISNLYNRLAVGDPVRSSLSSLYKIVKNLANQTLYNTTLYLNLYNPFSSSWNDIRTKHKAKKFAAYGYKEWSQIERSSRAVTWRNPRITNGVTQTYNYRSNLADLRSNFQATQQSAREWWRANNPFR